MTVDPGPVIQKFWLQVRMRVREEDTESCRSRLRKSRSVPTSALYATEKSYFEVEECWDGPCLGHTGKIRIKRMLILMKGRAMIDRTGGTGWRQQAARDGENGSRLRLTDVLEHQELSLNLLSKLVMSLIHEKHLIVLEHFLTIGYIEPVPWQGSPVPPVGAGDHSQGPHNIPSYISKLEPSLYPWLFLLVFALNVEPLD